MAKVLITAALTLLCVSMALLAARVAGAPAESGLDSINVLKLGVQQELGHDDDGGATSAEPALIDPNLRGYRQWAAFHITFSPASAMNFLSIQNSRKWWGKWYQYPNQDIEIANIDGTTIGPNAIGIIAGSGRKGAASGVEAEFDLFANGVDRIASVYFSCPFGASGNKVTITYHSQKYVIRHSAIPPKQTLGNVNPFEVIYLG